MVAILDNKKIKKKTDIAEYLYSNKDFKRNGINKKFKFSTNFKIKAATPGIKEDKRTIKGYAATDDKDRVNDIITLEGLQGCKNDLLQLGSNTVFFNHDRSTPIGKVVKTYVDSKGLVVEIEISKAKCVEDYWTQIKEGVLNSLSIGGRFKKVRIERDSENNVTAYKILELELMEVSVVGVPANPKANIFSVIQKSFKGFLSENKMKKKIKKVGTSFKKDESVFNDAQQNMIKSIVSEETKTFKASIETLANNVKELSEKMTANEIGSVDTNAVGPNRALKKAKLGKVKIVKSKSTVSKKWAKKLLKEVASLKKSFAETTSGRKGGFSTEEETEEEEEESETMVKALDGHGDPDSETFAKAAMNNPDLYDTLTKHEKELVGKCYMCLLDQSSQRKNSK